MYKFTEQKISLEDNLLQILTEPVEFSLLNIDKSTRYDNKIDYGYYKNSLTFMF